MSSVSAYGSFGSVYYVGSRGVGLGGDSSSFASVTQTFVSCSSSGTGFTLCLRGHSSLLSLFSLLITCAKLLKIRP